MTGREGTGRYSADLSAFCEKQETNPDQKWLRICNSPSSLSCKALSASLPGPSPHVLPHYQVSQGPKTESVQHSVPAVHHTLSKDSLLISQPFLAMPTLRITSVLPQEFTCKSSSVISTHSSEAVK